MNDNPKTQPPSALKETLARRIAKAGEDDFVVKQLRRQIACLLYTSPSPRDGLLSRMPSSA